MCNLDLPPGGEGVRGAPSASPLVETGAVPTAVELPAVAELAYDERDDRVGVVMELNRTYAVLRPSGGGVEWFVPLGYLHKALREQELRARVAELNAVSRWGRSL